MAAPVDPNEALILQSIAASKPAAAPAHGEVADPNEALILGSIKNHGKPQDLNSIGDKPGDAFRTREDMALAGTDKLEKFSAGLGLWFHNAGQVLTAGDNRPADGVTDKAPDGSILPKGAPVAFTNPDPNAEQNAALAGDAVGGAGVDVGAVIPSLAGGVGGAEAAAPAAERLLRPGAQGMERLLRWLGSASIRGAGAGAGGGLTAPADSPGQRLEHAVGGAATGALLGPTMESAVNTPALAGELRQVISKARGNFSPEQIRQMVSQYLGDTALQTPAEAEAAINAAPQVPGFKPTTAAATGDNGLYVEQAAMRAKDPGIFNQQVEGNDTAIRQAFNPMAPNGSNVQVSTAAVDRLRSIGEQEKAGVKAAYAPFDAIKDKVHLPTATVLDPADAVFNKLSTAEKDMIPQPILKRIYDWNEYVPFREVEGEMTALSNASSNAMATGNNNAARVIGNFRKALDQGLGNVDSVHNAAGDEIANFSSMNKGAQGQAPLESYKAGRAANVAYRDRFPTQGGDNTPDQNTVAKIVSGDTLPSEALDRVLNSPEQTATFLKSSGADPRVKELLVNHATNNLLEASRGNAGQLAGDKLIRNIAQNREIYQQFMNPAQMSALDTLSKAARMNNNSFRRIMPGESGTRALGNKADNMADLVSQAMVSGAEHVVPGAGMAMNMLKLLKKDTTQKQFEGLLTRALLDPPTYIRLRNMPVNQNTVGIVRKWLLGVGTPATIGGAANVLSQKFGESAAEQVMHQ